MPTTTSTPTPPRGSSLRPRAEPVFASRRAPARRRTRVLVVARTAAVRTAVLRDMARDAGVAGQTLDGTLAALVADGAIDPLASDFLVFETGADLWSDAHAVERLRARSAGALRCVAMVPAPVDAAAEAMLRSFGVVDVLPLSGTEDAGISGADPAAVADDDADQSPAPCPAPVLAVATVPAVPSATPGATVTPVPSATPDATVTPTPSASPDAIVAPVSTVATVAPGRADTGTLTVVLRARGGAGATTLAVNLALGLAQGEAATALVDLDIQNGSVGLALDLADSAAHGTWLRGETPADAAFLDRAMIAHSSGLHVLAAPDIFAPLSAITPERIGALLDALTARYGHVVLDLPQAVLDWTAPVLSRAARVLIVTDLTLPSIKRARRLMDLIGEEHMTLPVQVVVNQEKKPLLPSAVQKEAAKLLGQPLTHWIPADPKAARRALDIGVPMALGARRAPAARAIAAMAKSLLSSPRKAS